MAAPAPERRAARAVPGGAEARCVLARGSSPPARFCYTSLSQQGRSLMLRQSLVEYGKPLEATEAPTPTVLAARYCCASPIAACATPISTCRTATSIWAAAKSSTCAATDRCPSRSAMRSPAWWMPSGPRRPGRDKGKRYAAYPWIGCGKCGLCARGDEHLCNAPRALGVTVDGGYATHVLVPHPRYLLDVEGIAPEIAGAADVLRPDRLQRHQEGRCLSARRPAADRRTWRRRHDGAAVCPRR